jgi:hypothetical protein
VKGAVAARVGLLERRDGSRVQRSVVSLEFQCVIPKALSSDSSGIPDFGGF